MPQAIPVFYDDRMNAVLSCESTSPSSNKPLLQTVHWGTYSAERVEFHGFKPATREQLAMVHARDYVDGVLDCELPNGFMNFDKSVADSLPWTSGSMLAAAGHALDQQSFACSPSSGFHHAGPDYGGGFCTFNGLAMTAVILAKEGAKVGIIDSDAHIGNGTMDILGQIQDKKLSRRIQHRSWGQDFACGRPVSNEAVWIWHEEVCREMSDCDLVLYQAGADPHIDDPLGGMMTEEGFMIRETIVFGLLKAVAWNLAGGYRKDADGSIDEVLFTHDIALLAAYEKKNAGKLT